VGWNPTKQKPEKDERMGRLKTEGLLEVGITEGAGIVGFLLCEETGWAGVGLGVDFLIFDLLIESAQLFVGIGANVLCGIPTCFLLEALDIRTEVFGWFVVVQGDAPIFSCVEVVR